MFPLPRLCIRFSSSCIRNALTTTSTPRFISSSLEKKGCQTSVSNVLPAINKSLFSKPLCFIKQYSPQTWHSQRRGYSDTTKSVGFTIPSSWNAAIHPYARPGFPSCARNTRSFDNHFSPHGICNPSTRAKKTSPAITALISRSYTHSMPHNRSQSAQSIYISRVVSSIRWRHLTKNRGSQPTKPSTPSRFLRAPLLVPLPTLMALTVPHNEYKYDPLDQSTTQRNWYFWKKVLPIFLHYKYIEYTLPLRRGLTSLLDAHEFSRRNLGIFGQIDPPANELSMTATQHHQQQPQDYGTLGTSSYHPTNFHDISTTDHHPQVESSTRQQELFFPHLPNPMRQFFFRALHPFTRFLSRYKIYGDYEAYEQEQFDRLHDRYAQQAFHLVTSMRGFYVKFGQLLSLRTDSLPPQWIQQFSRLQSECPYDPWPVMQQLLAHELSEEKLNDFVSVNPIPLGAASIGQVHQAKLKDGTDVVIKLQYPNVVQLFQADIATLKVFCRLIFPDQIQFFDELEKQLMGEFDYLHEANNLLNAHHDLLTSPFIKVASVPVPFLDYCSKNVLTMSLLKGDRLLDRLLHDGKALADELGLSVEELMANPHLIEAPSPIVMSALNAYIQAKTYARNALAFLYNYSLGWFTAPFSYASCHKPLDLTGIIDTLFHFEGWAIFFGRGFNADVHPGNILYLEEKNQLGVIDYGQTKVMKLHERALLAQMYLAWSKSDPDLAAYFLMAIGYRTEHELMSSYKAYSILDFDHDTPESRMGMTLDQYVDMLFKQDKLEVVPPMVMMAAHVTFLLRGLASAVHYQKNVNEYWAPMADQFLKMHPYLDEWSQKACDVTRQYYLDKGTLRTKEFDDIIKHHFDAGENYHEEFYSQHFKQIQQHFDHKTGPHLLFKDLY